MDPAAVGGFYLRDGRAEQPDGSALIGPARIAAFLGGFRDYRVSAETMEVARIEPLLHHRWRITGIYRQAGSTPAGAAYRVSGGYVADWACHAGRWRLARLLTTPAPG